MIAMRRASNFVLCLPFLAFCSYSRADEVEQLFLQYYRNNGSDLVSGKVELLRHISNPRYDKALFMPPESTSAQDNQETREARLKRFYRYLSDFYDMNFSPDLAEQRYSAVRVYYDGQKKRKDMARFDQAAYHALLSGKAKFEEAEFERYFDDGSKMTSINDQGPINTYDPQVVITPDKLGIPRVSQFGRARGTVKSSEYMIKSIQSGFYQLSGQRSAEGFLVTAQSDKASHLKKIELLYDESDGRQILKRVREYGNLGMILDEETFEKYITTPAGIEIPTKIVSRQYTPLYNDGKTIKQSIAYEEQITVLTADYNIDIPEEIFVPDLPYGATVFDTTVSPPIQYIAHKVENQNKEDFFDVDALEHLRKLPESSTTPSNAQARPDANDSNLSDANLASAAQTQKDEASEPPPGELRGGSAERLTWTMVLIALVLLAVLVPRLRNLYVWFRSSR